MKVGGVDLKPASGGAYLKESDLAKLKTIFWANNITGVSPELPVQMAIAPKAGDPLVAVNAVGYWFDHDFNTLKTGAPALHPWWRIKGSWPAPHSSPDSRSVVVGTNLAKKLGLKIGDTLVMQGTQAAPSSRLTADIAGIVTTGGEDDNGLLLTLHDAQVFVGENDAVRRVEVSARTKPEDAFARVDPDSLPPKQREIWYCRPYANSIAYQIREQIPGAQAEQVRRVEQSEGNVLKRISGLMWLISAAALLAAGFAVSAAMATAILERQGEIGLMRSLGASKGSIALLFYAEAGLLALIAGTMGYLLGSGLAAWLGARIFAGDGGAAEAVLIPVLLPVVVALALVVAIAGSTPSIRTALRMEPSAILRADA
ncbi:FtsX-like permease family protein [Tunturiibacter empetritectus]|uniref:ABC transporter permease n=1 Tax=Tunturiibacter empetritectus TaxID=3069691 RepID=UPI003D9BA9B0